MPNNTLHFYGELEVATTNITLLWIKIDTIR